MVHGLGVGSGGFSSLGSVLRWTDPFIRDHYNLSKIKKKKQKMQLFLLGMYFGIGKLKTRRKLGRSSKSQSNSAIMMFRVNISGKYRLVSTYF